MLQTDRSMCVSQFFYGWEYCRFLHICTVEFFASQQKTEKWASSCLRKYVYLECVSSYNSFHSSELYEMHICVCFAQHFLKKIMVFFFCKKNKASIK